MQPASPASRRRAGTHASYMPDGNRAARFIGIKRFQWVASGEPGGATHRNGKGVPVSGKRFSPTGRVPPLGARAMSFFFRFLDGGGQPLASTAQAASREAPSGEEEARCARLRCRSVRSPPPRRQRREAGGEVEGSGIGRTRKWPKLSSPMLAGTPKSCELGWKPSSKFGTR